MDIVWVRIRSWHAIRAGMRTQCGRDATGHPVSPTMPTGKSCETCLRVIARSVDA